MTGRCKLCNTIVTADPDGLLDAGRLKRMSLLYGRKVREHMITHPNAVKAAKALAEIYEALALFAHIETREDDGGFAADVRKMRDELLRAAEPTILDITKVNPQQEAPK